jgi:hypothetical protein
MGQSSPPSPPNAAQDYAAGIQTFLKYLPKMERAEFEGRQKWDPRFIEQQLGFQEKYGPRQYSDMLAAQKQLDPYGVAARAQLGQSVIADAKLGTKLDPAFAQQLQTEIRGAQAARGNTQGNAGISGETLYQGRAAQQMYQQRLGNLGNFLQLRTPEADMAFVPGVQAPDQFRLVNPNAGVQGQQIGQQNYQNQLAAYSMGNQGSSGQFWGQGIGATAGGIVGGIYGGPAGSQVGVSAGGAAGGAVGGYFSSKRTKRDITKIGEHNGMDKVQFRYKGGHTWYRGVIAEQVQKLFPDAVYEDNGLLRVLYDALGVPFEKKCRKCGQFKDINNFHKRANCESRDGHRNTCIECINVYKRGYYGEKHRDKWQQYHHDYYKAHKKEFREQKLRQDFGLSLEDYEKMSKEQGGVCAICSNTPNGKPLSVDHCHSTKRVRGLLCNYCNTGLGNFRDNPAVLVNAVSYLVT